MSDWTDLMETVRRREVPRVCKFCSELLRDSEVGCGGPRRKVSSCEESRIIICVQELRFACDRTVSKSLFLPTDTRCLYAGIESMPSPTPTSLSMVRGFEWDAVDLPLKCYPADGWASNLEVVCFVARMRDLGRRSRGMECLSSYKEGQCAAGKTS